MVKEENKFVWKWKYLDPFFPYDKLIEYLKKKKLSNKITDFIIFIVYALILAYIILRILALILGSSEAMMIVVSGSMEPKLNIGDVSVLHSPKTINTTYVDLNRNIKDVAMRDYLEPIYSIDGNTGYPVINDLNVSGQIVKPNLNGDILVYYSSTQKKEIIHRAILGIRALDGTFYITKGDNTKTNFVMDNDCGAYFNTAQGTIKFQCLYPYALQKENVLSRYFFKIPYLGWIKLGPAYLLGWRAQ